MLCKEICLLSHGAVMNFFYTHLTGRKCLRKWKSGMSGNLGRTVRKRPVILKYHSSEFWIIERVSSPKCWSNSNSNVAIDEQNNVKGRTFQCGSPHINSGNCNVKVIWSRQEKKQGRIHGNPVADGWAGAVMQKTIGIQKCDGRTYWPTYRPTHWPTRQGVEFGCFT